MTKPFDPHQTAFFDCLRCGQTFEDLDVGDLDTAWCPYCDRAVAAVRR